MATPENLHKNIPNAQLHSPKDFSTAGSGTALRKGWDGDLKWEIPYWQDSVLDRVDMALTPPTEFDGDRYILINLTSTVVNAGWDGASENDIVEYDLDASAWVSQTPFFDITVRSQADLTQYYFDGTTWNDASGGGITNIVEDTTPQLGGTLDANGNIIDMGVNTITDTKVGNWDTAFGWGDHSTAGYLSNVVEDTTPQLGGDLDVQTNEIISTGSNNIGLHSNASAYVELGDNLGTNTFDIKDNASAVKAQFKSTGDLGVGTTASSGAWTSLAGSNNNRAHINFTGGTADKTTPVDGDLWYNTTAGTLNFYDGTTTTDLLAGGGGSLWTDSGTGINYSGFSAYVEFEDQRFQLAPSSVSNTLGAFVDHSAVIGTGITAGGGSGSITNSLLLGTTMTIGNTANITNNIIAGASLTLDGGSNNLMVGRALDVDSANDSWIGGDSVNNTTSLSNSLVFSTGNMKLTDTVSGAVIMGYSQFGVKGDNIFGLGYQLYAPSTSNNKVMMLGFDIQLTNPADKSILIGSGQDDGQYLQITSAYEKGVYFGSGSSKPFVGFTQAQSGVGTGTTGKTGNILFGKGIVDDGGTANTGEGVLWMEDAVVNPTATISGAGALYVESGALKFRGGSGTVTTIAVA